MKQVITTLIAMLCLAFGIWGLEAPRQGLEIQDLQVGETPVTVMQRPGVEAPVVIIAHGFAGSRQLMSAWQLTLAQAGYITLSFDFEGHGANPVPMSGDVTALDGTTRLLMEEIGRVTDFAVTRPGAEPRVALIGHSMASDIIVRQGLEDPRTEALVGISLFSQAVTAQAPENLLIVNGAWEGALRQEAVRVMAELQSEEGETVGTPGEGFARRAVAAPFVEHVGVLYSPTALLETETWLSESFGIDRVAAPAILGPWILLTFFGAVLLAQPLAQAFPQGATPWRAGPKAFWALALGPALATPILLSLFDTRFLPVLVADYLALHLALYGILVLVGVAFLRGLPTWRGAAWGLALALYGLGVFGGLLDRYVGSFVPISERLTLIAIIVPGAVLAMVADACLNEAMQARLWRRIVVRGMFLMSLGIAVALDFERLFFLIIILPVILLFYLTFGMMGRFLGRRTGSVVAVGVGLGLILGWALGVTFPLFDPGA